jgi:predicted helicase
VFDIQQGVAITFFVKNNKKKNNELATVYHVDAYGKRNNKYDWLDNITIENIDFTTVENVKPQYLFVPKDYKLLGRYGKYISISDLFSINSVGIVTSRDSFVIDTHKTNLSNRIKDFFISDRDTILSKYDIRENKSRKINDTKLATKYDNNCITKVNYRPFDIKYIYYEKNFIERSRETIMSNYINTKHNV